jgi:hypothetical protein
VPVPVGMKQVFLQEIYSECILNIVKAVDGEHLYMNEGTSGGFKEVILK